MRVQMVRMKIDCFLIRARVPTKALLAALPLPGSVPAAVRGLFPERVLVRKSAGPAAPAAGVLPAVFLFPALVPAAGVLPAVFLFPALVPAAVRVAIRG